jgi:perosamine synthetase
MSELALDGGTPLVKGRIKRFNTIGALEAELVVDRMRRGPLSGYLGGIRRGGAEVASLELEWAHKFGVKHAIACNSATGGLLAACVACGIGRWSTVLTTSMTMSATAAAPRLLGADLHFCDVEAHTFLLDPHMVVPFRPNFEAVILTNLFGSAVNESWWAGWCREHEKRLIVDASQAPLATEDGTYGGTMGDVGVFSLNVHKHIQAGEGGICVTNDNEMADRIRDFINHGEMAGRPAVGLNLRMTEITAAIARAQLRRADDIISGRVALATRLSLAVRDIAAICPPYEHPDCRHVFYVWAGKIVAKRDWYVEALRAEGVPIRAGYVEPLYRLPAFKQYARGCPVAERLHDKELAIFEVCAWDPSDEQLHQIEDAFQKVAEHA